MLIICNRSIASGKPFLSHTDTCVAVTFENNIEKNELKIKVKSRPGTAMKLFIFTPDGILINGVAVAANEITTVKSLDKGLYLYECFDNDERMKSVSLLIK